MFKICYIDDKNSEAKTYGRALKTIFDGQEIELLVICPPYEDKNDFLRLLDDKDVVTLIIDHKLQDKVTYSGMELAIFIRSVNNKLPIYILTNYGRLEDEFAGNEWSVEDIIEKDKLSDKAEIYKARILRRINVYSDVLSDRELRFHELLRKSLKAEITVAEMKEIEELQLARTSSFLAQELSQLEALETMINSYEKNINKLKKI